MAFLQVYNEDGLAFVNVSHCVSFYILYDGRKEGYCVKVQTITDHRYGVFENTFKTRKEAEEELKIYIGRGRYNYR